ncbi:hypothetical protein BH20CHL7_BH20CHL7_11980 [soil metagenome]
MSTKPHADPTSRRPLRRSILLVAGLAVLVAALALPALAADPTDQPGPPAGVPGQGRAEAARGPKAAKVPKEPITLRGTVAAVTDADGRTRYTMTVDGKTYDLDAGPSWFHGDAHPLKGSVNKTVTVTGESAAGSTEVDVLAVDGTALREPGRPPWAGGWKRVGEGHPGWSQEKADRFKAKFGDCFPPGKCRKDAAGGS